MEKWTETYLKFSTRHLLLWSAWNFNELARMIAGNLYIEKEPIRLTHLAVLCNATPKAIRDNCEKAIELGVIQQCSLGFSLTEFGREWITLIFFETFQLASGDRDGYSDRLMEIAEILEATPKQKSRHRTIAKRFTERKSKIRWVTYDGNALEIIEKKDSGKP